MDRLSLVLIFVFLAASIAFQLFASVFIRSRRNAARINRRLSLGDKLEQKGQVLAQLRRERWIGSGQLENLGYLRTLVVQSGIRMTTQRVVLLPLAVFAAAFALGMLITGSKGLSGVAAFAMTLVLVYGYLVLARARRITRFGTQLPDAVDVMVRSLRVGHPVPTALTLVAEEMADPIGSEFGMAADEVTYGSDLPSAIANLARRVGHPDLQFIVVAIGIQSTTGGNLAVLLANLSQIIRARFKLMRKVRALSSEGRFSAVALTILPFAMFGILTLMSPDVWGTVWMQPSWPMVMSGCLAMIAVGNVIMYKMVNFKV
jgi:tight adherence protein B